RFLHQADADPFAILSANDWPVLRAIDGERLFSHALHGFVRHSDHRGGYWTFFVAVLVVELVALPNDRFQIFIDSVDGARSVHPAAVLVETLIDKELAPGHRAVGIQAFVAGHLQFRSEIERRV